MERQPCAARWAVATALVCALAGAAAADEVRTANGFRLAPASIPVDQIRQGGPPRDGIPALDAPKTLPAAESPWSDEEFVVGVELGGEARAYPIAILTWHELANDTLGGVPILVSYCPLCGTALVFDRRVDGEVRHFGVSGLLYLSDLLMYDHETDSLWSQILAEAVVGPSLGKRLPLLRSRTVAWGEWRAKHPTTSVLSPDTGHARDYARSPYGDYALSDRVIFGAPVDRRYHPKMPTVGLRTSDGAARAYPAAEIVAAGGEARDMFEGRPVRVAYDPERQVFEVDAPPDVQVIEGFWFAWMAFHPASSVFQAKPESARPGTEGASPPPPEDGRAQGGGV